MINEHTLHIFLEVYRTESIQLAAQALYVSPQSISKTILDMEAELDEKLFIRNHRKLTPTPQALRLKLHAERILEEYRLIRNGAREVSHRQELKIYCTYGVAEFLGSAFAEQFSRFQPDILVYLIEVPDKQAQELLKTRDDGLAILSDPCDSNTFDQKKLFSCSYSYVLSENNPLAEKRQISVQDVIGGSIVGKGSEFQQYINQMSRFSSPNEGPFVAFETTSYHLAMQIAKDSMASALVPTYLAEEYAPQGTVVRPGAANELEKPFFLVMRKGTRLSPQQDCFIRFLTEFCSHRPYK